MLNGNLKSQSGANSIDFEFCIGLSTNLLTDVLQQAGLDANRDVETLRRRARREGLGFLTKTLPGMGKAIQQALLGKRLSIPQFRKMRGTVIPHFMKGLLSRCFSLDGFVLDDADICAITDLIQCCFLFYKLEVPYDPKTNDKVLNTFVAVDEQLPENYEHLGSSDTRLEPNVLLVARSVINQILRKFNPKDITPKHGPGAVATGEMPHQKMHFKRIYDNAEEVYPATEHYYLNGKHLFDAWDEYWSLDHVSEPEAKVVLVPKDSRGPRLISAEPLEIQYLQQGLGRKLVAWIERHPITRGRVNFTDQAINRRLALEGSANGKWATLDLKEASDRVSLALVRELFADTDILPYLLATRSTRTVLPDGRVVQMRKFAPMGSALCFPIEALCFYALGVACIHVYGAKPMSMAKRSIYVYGDDIITRAGLETSLLQNFHYFSLRINEKKSCFTGSFRESCGCDAFRGEVVTPIKVKRLPPKLGKPLSAEQRRGEKRLPKSSMTDGASLASWVSISNLLFQKAYYRAAHFCKNRVEQVWGNIPFSQRDPQRALSSWDSRAISDSQRKPFNGEEQSPIFPDSAPCWYVRQVPSHDDQVTHQLSRKRLRYNAFLQRWEYSALVILPLTYIQRKGISDRSEMFRHFLSGLATTPFRYSFLRRVKLKRRWTSVAY